MTLLEIITAINRVAESQPTINTVIKDGNIYTLNDLNDVVYGAFCITQQEHEESEGLFNFHAYLYYVDREKDDHSNKIEVQSTAISTLSNIINTLRRSDIWVDEGVTFQVFEERFGSLCAGAYAEITISVPYDECVEMF